MEKQERAKILSPEDLDLTWGDVGLLLKGVTNGKARQKVLMDRFYISEKTASVWLEGLRQWERENRIAS